MGCEFLAIITGDGMNRVTFQQINHALFDGLFSPLFDQSHPQEATFSINQGHNGTFHAFANDGVSFPVPNPFSCFNERWTFLYTSLAGYFTSIVALCTSFSILLLPPKMLVQLAAIPFVFPDMLVDPFVTDLDTISLQDPLSGLFRAEILSQVSLNDDPVFTRNPFSGFVLSPFCYPLCLLVPITSFSGISPQLSANRRFMNSYNLRDFRLIVAYFQKLIYKVSLFIGKLRVTHECSFNSGKWKEPYSTSAYLPISSLVALTS